jgi:hypothetical protein
LPQTEVWIWERIATGLTCPWQPKCRTWPSAVHLRAVCQEVIPVVAIHGIWPRNLANDWIPAPAILHQQFPCLLRHKFLTHDVLGVIQIHGGLFRPKLYTNGLSWQTISWYYSLRCISLNKRCTDTTLMLQSVVRYGYAMMHRSRIYLNSLLTIIFALLLFCRRFIYQSSLQLPNICEFSYYYFLKPEKIFPYRIHIYIAKRISFDRGFTQIFRWTVGEWFFFSHSKLFPLRMCFAAPVTPNFSPSASSQFFSFSILLLWYVQKLLSDRNIYGEKKILQIFRPVHHNIFCSFHAAFLFYLWCITCWILEAIRTIAYDSHMQSSMHGTATNS